MNSTPADLSSTGTSVAPATLPAFAVLGAGRIGRAMTADLLASGADRVLLIDSATALPDAGSDPRLETRAADLGDAAVAADLLGGIDTVVSAVPYRLNAPLARIAVDAGANWVDLGGNTEVVEEILGLGERAAAQGVSVVPDAGLQPGLGNILAGEIYRRLGGADVLRVLVGGLPQHPEGELQYQLVFSIEGLLNEYHGDVRTLDGGEMRIREPLTGVEDFPWPGLPALEAFHTSGSASTLPQSFRSRAGRVEVKTVRYTGHAAVLQRIFAEVPRERRAAHIEAMVPHSGADLVVMRVEGEYEGRRLTFELEDRFDLATGFTAMMRTTGFPASLVAQMAARRELPAGAVIQERDVPAGPVIDGLRARGVEIRETTS